MEVKLINNNSGFDCTDCIYLEDNRKCSADFIHSDCDIDIVYKEVEETND